MTSTPRTRAFATAVLALLALPLLAQTDPAPPQATSAPVPMTVNYALIAVALVEFIFILSLSGIMRTMALPGAPWPARKGGRVVALLPLLFLVSAAHAQAYQGDHSSLSSTEVFWWLLAIDLFLLVIIVVQLSVLRVMTRALTGADQIPVEQRRRIGPGWEARVLRLLTRQVAMEREEDVLLHHDYDGIRELDNVLPPWWLWLFYGTIIFAVIYVINMDVLKAWPDQRTEYAMEMKSAQEAVAAYNAMNANMVDENSARALTDATTLSSGNALFHQYCVSCHGQNAEGNVGPNLTDDHWLHGGGIKNVFHTITYGVSEKGMISWKSQLKPTEIQAVASYILSLRGTDPANAKPPQGEIWTPPADSTTSAIDTLHTAADTVKVAMR